jgi:hypothetical protein
VLIDEDTSTSFCRGRKINAYWEIIQRLSSVLLLKNAITDVTITSYITATTWVMYTTDFTPMGLISSSPTMIFVQITLDISVFIVTYLFEKFIRKKKPIILMKEFYFPYMKQFIVLNLLCVVFLHLSIESSIEMVLASPRIRGLCTSDSRLEQMRVLCETIFLQF